MQVFTVPTKQKGILYQSFEPFWRSTSIFYNHHHPRNGIVVWCAFQINYPFSSSYLQFGASDFFFPVFFVAPSIGWF